VMISSSRIDSLVDGITILVNKAISIDDIDSYINDLKNDFLTSNGINLIVGMLASFIGQQLGLFSASIITVRHMESRASEKLAEQEQVADLMT